jgi:hypothetical protein
MAKCKVWTMKDGQQIKIEQMTSSHIENCIKALEEDRINRIISLGWANDNDYVEYMEDTEWKRDWINAFEEELEKRGVKI